MISGIYLAAGQSKRMGQSKLSLPMDKQRLGSIALKTALQSKLDLIVVVTQAEDPLNWISSDLFHLPYSGRWLHMPCKESFLGQSASLKCGLNAAIAADAEAVMILLADQPFITKGIINQLIGVYREGKQPFIAASYEGVCRPPVLFHSSMFRSLLELQGDEGARRILRTSKRKGITVEVTDAEFFIDIDTPRDYEHVKMRGEAPHYPFSESNHSS